MLGEALKNALDAKKNDINMFEWKYAKQYVNGEVYQPVKRLVDMELSELKYCLNYCDTMLNNDKKETLGRYNLLALIEKQRHSCNIALFVRWVETVVEMPKFKFLELINSLIDNNIQQYPDIRSLSVDRLFEDNQVPIEYRHLTLSDALNGCLDQLGKFDKKAITLTFITKQGIWLTSDELEELSEMNENGTFRDRLEVIKERLLLKDNVKLTIRPNGLSFKQFRSMVNLKSKNYSELTQDQLIILRDKILFKLETDVKKHIKFWNDKINEIERVIESKE